MSAVRAPKRPPLTAISDDGRPEIVISPDEPAMTDAAITALAAGADIYQRFGALVDIVSDEASPRGLSRTESMPRFRALPLPRLRELMVATAKWIQIKEDTKGEKVRAWACPPEKTVKQVAARGEWKGIRPLTGIIEAPTLRPDGTVLDAPGYDAQTGLLYVPSADFGRIDDQPTKEDAQRAMHELYEIVADFPFSKTTPAKQAWLAAALTPFAHHAINGPTPFNLIDKNIRGAGSGLLAEVTTSLSSGRPAPVMTNPETDDEMRKRVTSQVIAGVTQVLIDNINNELGGASLDAAITARTWNDRILGKNELSIEAPIKMIWWGTGNNVQIVADTARRVLHIRLESPEETPEERTGFKHADLRAWVAAERPRLVRAALTILRAYFAAGRPSMGLKPWGSFESWSDLIRGAVVWLGETDPGETRIELTKRSDTEAAALLQLLDALEFAAPINGGLTAGKMLSISATGTDHEALREAIAELCPMQGGKAPSSKSLGRRLNHFRGRVIGGRYLDAVGDSKGSTLWGVVKAGAGK